jgi:hypothetical protein
VPTFATVEGTLVHATPSTFAGRRKNMSLGRSEASVAGLVPMQAFSPTTTGALWKKEEGNVVSVREAHALGAPMPKKHRHVSRTRPSLGPETRARQSALNSSMGNHPEVSRQSRYRGRENLRKQEEPAPGPRLDGRSAARRVSPLSQGRSCVMRKKRKVVMATVPARKRETRAQRPYVVCSCRSRQAASWPRISSYAALSKRVAVRVNGGLGGAASGEKSSGTTSIERKADVSDSHRCERCRTGQDPERRENVAQRSSPLRLKAKQGDGGRGTGAERPPDPTKGPRRWKAPQDVTSHRLSRVGGHGDLGGFFTRETIANGSPELERSKAERRPCRHSSRARGRRDRGVRGMIGSRRRGKKTPTLFFTHRNGA